MERLPLRSVAAPKALLAGALLVAALLAGSCDGGGGKGDLSALESAERALAEGRALDARTELLALAPSSLPDGPARRRAAAALLKVNLPSQAADLLAKDVPGQGGRNGEAALLRLEGLVRSGRVPEAQAFLGEMERAGHAGDRRRVLRAMLALLERNEGEAVRDLEDLVRKGARDADAHVLWAQLVIGIPEEAERRLTRGLELAVDRATMLRALGRFLLDHRGDPRRAAPLLVEAVRLHPWDRTLRADLVRALRRTGLEGDLAMARREAERLREEDPADFGSTLALAEVLGETALVMAAAAEGNAAAGREPLLACIALYRELASGAAPDPVGAVRVMHGLARAETEAIFLDAQGDDGPASHFAAAMTALDRAEGLDPAGTLRVEGAPWTLRTETLYLRARAVKRVHSGQGDHTTAVGLYEKAAMIKEPHLEAMWDLALLYADLLRDPAYVRRAANLMRKHVQMRERLGMPELDPSRRALMEEVTIRAEKGVGFGDEEALPTGPEEPPKPPVPPKRGK